VDVEIGLMHKVILLVMAGYSSKEAYRRAETEEELRQRENTIAAELQLHPPIIEALANAGEDESARVDAIYQLAGLSLNQISALERSFQGMSAVQIAREMSRNKDRPEVPVRTAERWLYEARRKLVDLSLEPAEYKSALVESN